MKLLLTYFKHRKLFFSNFLFVVVALCYFLFFVNKGIVLSDEGYYVHYAERIANGEIVYKDFLLQYTPGYFYLLAGLYKLFGVQLLVGRFLSLVICLGIIVAVFALLRVYKITSITIHVVTALLLITLTYPLLHVPIVVWICVLFTVLITIFLIKWYREHKRKDLLILGLFLTGMLFFKQSLGAYFIPTVTVLIFFGAKGNWKERIQSIFLLNFVWITVVAIILGIYYLQVKSIDGIVQMFEMSRQFLKTYSFSYPPLTLLFQPTGFFKLLPYYFPIVYLVILVIFFYKKRVTYEKSVFSILALVGFFGTVYPASDLLHVYPFLGILLISSIVIFYKQKGFNLLLALMVVFMLFGVYMTFYMKSYRYEGYFLRETTQLPLPRTQGIQVDYTDPSRSKLVEVYDFFQQHTKKEDYIFVYPFAPMMYYIMDRNNPNGIVQYVLLEAPESAYSEDRVLNEIRAKKVKYILAVGPYVYDRKISRFIQKQKRLYKTESYEIFEIVKP